MITWRIPLAVALLALFCHQSSFAQVGPWDRVKLIEPGKKVEVRLHSGKSVNGKMEAWTAEGITVRRKAELSMVPKSDILRVALVTGTSRARRAAWAGLITGGILGTIGGIACASSSCSEFEAGVVAGGTAAWAGIAAGIAALFPQSKEVIYTAPAFAAAATY